MFVTDMKNNCIYYPKKDKIFVNCYFYGFWIDKDEFLKFKNIKLSDCIIVKDN
jgi:hypothetical protein